VYSERIEKVETAFESSEFHQLILEATGDSLNRALELFNVPDGVDVTLRGRPTSVIQEEVRIFGVARFSSGYDIGFATFGRWFKSRSRHCLVISEIGDHL